MVARLNYKQRKLICAVYDGDVAVVNTTTKDDQADEIPIGEDLKEDLLKLEP